MNSCLRNTVADALKKCVEISNKDAENFPNEKMDIFSSTNICALSVFYTVHDPDLLMKDILSIESNQKRLRNEMTFIFKIWMMSACDNIDVNKKVRQGDKMRCLTLARKYNLLFDCSELLSVFFVFPDIFCNLCLKYPKNSYSIYPQLGYKNFKDEHKWPFFIAMIPSGKKYGGFVKALLHGNFCAARQDSFIRFMSGVVVMDGAIASLRVAYNVSFISQEKRLEFFEKLNISEADCIQWSQEFDRQFPKHAYVHKMFGQIA